MTLTSNTIILYDKKNNSVPFLICHDISNLIRLNLNTILIPHFENTDIIQIDEFDGNIILLDSDGKLNYIFNFFGENSGKIKIKSDLCIVSVSIGCLCDNIISICGVDNNGFVHLWDFDETQLCFSNSFKINIIDISIAKISDNYICMIDLNNNGWVYVPFYEKIINICSDVKSMYFHKKNIVILCDDGTLYISDFIEFLCKGFTNPILKNVNKLNKLPDSSNLSILNNENKLFIFDDKLFEYQSSINNIIDFYSLSHKKYIISADNRFFIDYYGNIQEFKIYGVSPLENYKLFKLINVKRAHKF